MTDARQFAWVRLTAHNAFRLPKTARRMIEIRFREADYVENHESDTFQREKEAHKRI
jgi:hypothetical protein